MGVDKVVIQVGNEIDKPTAGDKVTTTYTGWFYDPHRVSDGYRGKQYDFSMYLVGSDCLNAPHKGPISESCSRWKLALEN